MAAHANACVSCGDSIEAGARVQFQINREYHAQQFQTETIGRVVHKFYLCEVCASDILEDLGTELPDIPGGGF